MDYFQDNIKVLELKDKLFALDIVKKNELIDYDESVCVGKARSGEDYLKVRVEDQEISFQSEYSPIAEAKRYSEQWFDLPLYSRVAFFGFADGKIARILREKYGNMKLSIGPERGSRLFAFFEPDVNIFLFVMHHYDLTDILSDPNISVFVDGINHQKYAIWCYDNIDCLSVGSFYFSVLPKYGKYYPSSLKDTRAIYDDVKFTIDAYNNTSEVNDKNIIINNLNNIKWIAKAKDIRDLIKAYPCDLPYIIVSSGPSLADRIDFLKDIKGKSYIVAADTAVGFLLDNEVVPNAIVTVDPNIYPWVFDSRMRDLTVFISAYVNYEALDVLKPKDLFVISNNLEYFDYLFRLDIESGYNLDIGGCVANAAFSLGVVLGAKKIMMVGQDLSFGKNRDHIRSDIKTNALGYDEVEIDGNDGVKVKTTKQLLVYRDWFAREIAKHPEVNVYNITKGGAQIEGALYSVPSSVMYLFDKKERIIASFDEILKKIGPSTKEVNMSRVFISINDSLSKMKPLLSEGIEIADNAINNMEEDDYYSILRLADDKLNSISSMIEEIPVFDLLNSYISGKHAAFLSNLYMETVDKREESIMILTRLKDYYTALYSSIDSLLEIASDAYKRIERQY